MPFPILPSPPSIPAPSRQTTNQPTQLTQTKPTHPPKPLWIGAQERQRRTETAINYLALCQQPTTWPRNWKAFAFPLFSSCPRDVLSCVLAARRPSYFPPNPTYARTATPSSLPSGRPAASRGVHTYTRREHRPALVQCTHTRMPRRRRGRTSLARQPTGVEPLAV